MSIIFKINTNKICVPKHALECKLPNWFTSISDSEVWKKGTALIVGNSIVFVLRESKTSFSRNMKVLFFFGARIQDMYRYLVQLLHKRPDKIIIHVVQTTHHTFRMMKCWKK